MVTIESISESRAEPMSEALYITMKMKTWPTTEEEAIGEKLASRIVKTSPPSKNLDYN